MDIDLRDKAVVFRGTTLLHEDHLASFLALLAAVCTEPGKMLSGKQAIKLLCPDVRVTRTRFKRITDKAKVVFGSRNPIGSDHPTSGPWWLEPGAEPIRVFYNGAALDAPAVLAALAPPARQGGPLMLSPAIDIPTLQSIAEGDAFFARGNLADAERVFAGLSTVGGDTGRAIALMRLLNTYRREEDYPAILKAARRLKAIARKLESEEFGDYVTVAADLALAWYDYANDHRYDVLWEKLPAIGRACDRFTSLHIDWQNLYSLAARRRALMLTGPEKADAALDSLNVLHSSLVDAVVFGNPYQVQQSAANLANLISLFGDPRHGAVVPTGDAARDALEYLQLSNAMCQQFRIGNDELYNAIYLMSHARRHKLSADDVRHFVDLGFGGGGLARYGDIQFRRDGLSAAGPEQRAFLAREICHAAIAEDEITLFADYAPIVAETAFELSDSLVKDYQRSINGLIALATPKHSRSPDWLGAIRSLRAGLR